MSQLQIREDDLTGKKIADLLREDLENMHEITPPESIHALDLEALKSPNITFCYQINVYRQGSSP
jgi:putative acetyltransferase